MSGTVEVQLSPAPRSADTAALCASLSGRLLDGSVRCVRCRADRLPGRLDVVDALARLHLTARRAGARLLVDRPSAELRALLVLVGLDELLAPGER